MSWELISNIILGLAFLVLAVFIILGLQQWITRRSLQKVDRGLLWMPLPLALMAITYLVFDKIWPFTAISTRPNGSGEPSFPSTHVMMVATILFLATLNLPKYVKNPTLRLVIEILVVISVVLTCVGRVLANMHWVTDVIGGLIFAFIFTEIYYLIIKPKKGKK